MKEIIVNGESMIMEVLLAEDVILKRVQELASEINEDYANDKPLTVLVVLDGAFIFAADLVRGLRMPTDIETIHLKSYEGTSSTGEVKMTTSLPSCLQGKDVLIVEDIIETGTSLEFLLKKLADLNVSSVKICTLLNKPECRKVKIEADYVGFNIGKNFVIGYGLDLDSRYRNLSFIGDLKKKHP